MNFLSDKIKFYTNIIISGAISSAPLLWYISQLHIMEQAFFISSASILIVFVGRICLEIAILTEINLIDKFVECKSKKPMHYANFIEKNNLTDRNWYNYILIENYKRAHEVIIHLADRLLFLLSSSIASIIGGIILISIYQYEVLHYFWIFIIVVFYLIFAFKRAISIAIGLDFLRYYILENQKKKIEN